MTPTPDFPVDRTRWFEDARYGMFVHWGLYSRLGRGEWALNRERIALDEYVKLADEFDAAAYRPREWARLAREAGMKYVVLTTKHHEGFCLWNSRACAFNATNSAAKRDLLSEYVEAVRAEGLKVGLYYSLGDWFNPDWACGWQGDVAARARFMDYTHALVRELMTDYGQIDILWYDLPQCYSADQWRSAELNAMVRALQPQILINNRAMTTEDYATPEQHIAAAPKGRLWEACMTLNDSWGYRPADRNWKSPTDVARNLASVAAGGGNLLLNVGPDGDGKIPTEAAAILRETGQWLDRCGAAIYDVQRHDLPWLLAGQLTCDGNTLYLFPRPYEGPQTTIGGLTVEVKNVSILGGDSVDFEQRGPQLFLNGLPATAPDAVQTVVKIELEGEPDFDLSRVIGAADVMPIFPN